MNYILPFIALFIFNTIFSQPTITVAAPGESGSYGSIRYNDDAALLAKQKNVTLSYADILGSPFWERDWNPAILVLANNTAVKVEKAKLNLYTGEIHFMNAKNIEMTADKKDIVKAIFFKNSDTTKVLGTFELQLDIIKSSDICYYRVLNKGETKLLEQKTAYIKQGDYNALTGKNDQSFFTKTSYAVLHNNNLSYLPSLNQPNIISILSPTPEMIEWIKLNKYKLRTESEVVSFLNYYNSVKK
ncbi:MAG: hypothetical protein J0I09_14515 [Sphingobacteriia bacterium]|nr:hypothetical protein [Sphingobacteriia bacterium]